MTDPQGAKFSRLTPGVWRDLLRGMSLGAMTGFAVEAVIAAVLWLFFREPDAGSFTWLARITAFTLTGFVGAWQGQRARPAAAVAAASLLVGIERLLDHSLWETPSLEILVPWALLFTLYGCYLESRRIQPVPRRRGGFRRWLLRRSAVSWIVFSGAALPWFTLWRSGIGVSVGCASLFFLLLITLAFGLSGAAVQTLEEIKLQWIRATESEMAVQAVLAGETFPHPYVLYLRPFFITGQLEQPNVRVPMTVGSFSQPATTENEREVAKALESSAVFLGLGRPGEFPGGASRIASSEENWQPLVQTLAASAAAILVVPSSRPGTRWEISWLKSQGHFAKCLFIMPPQSKKSKLSIADVWEEARRELVQEGISLPEYSRCGCFFKIEALNGQPYDVQPYLFGGLAGTTAKIIRQSRR